ncbi:MULTISPECIES: YcaO-like family protein [unclassified Legionella]|uniref:YcaO-like family protein n=1 Tax=unclassified Legionella TaxID=2622702 RepID=UPI0010556F31|nr:MULTISPECIES: YcaO-like family protein [unclassified Legionella]MDI9817797.1 YcaO-like family protein [Legionella sp. PL877]
MIVKPRLLNTSVAKIKHASLQHAQSFRICRDGLLSAPRSLMLDGIISYGGGTGKSIELVRKGFGEYYERNHFFTAVPLTSKKKLSDINPVSHQKKLASLCQNIEQQHSNHHFALTQVHNLYTQEPYDYFYNAISLRTMKNDNPFLSVSDSCACASHTHKDKALYHSLIEFLERQALLGSWMSKTIRYSINPQVLHQISPYTHLVETLLDNGDIYIFENGNQLPGYNVIMFYFAQSPEDAVQYSVGCKTAGSLSDAICSAFEELYQCYTFLYGSVFKETNLENKAGTGYHMAFVQYNHQETKSRIPYFNKASTHLIHTKEDIDCLPQFSYNRMLEELKHISTDIYYYHYFEQGLGLHFTKILSPDFFAHMSLNKPLNLQCRYARVLNIDPGQAYLEMLPFP